MKINKEVVQGSFVLLVAFGIYNIFNFAFQASMARLLTLAEFGILSVLYQLIYLFSGISESIQITMVKFSANEKNKGIVKNILKRALKKSFIISLGVFFVYLLVAVPLSILLDIDYFLISFTGLILFSVFLMPITRGILQGKRKFASLGINMVSESGIKLILAILLVVFSFGVFGAMVGTLIGGAAAFALSFVSLKDILHSKEERANTKEIYDYSKPSLVIILTILLFYTFDVMVIKLFFAPETAGSYAVASLMAKVIFFGTQPISKAMFPISAEKSVEKGKSANILVNAIVMVLLLALIALAIFYFFPERIINLFSGKVIFEAEGILLYLGICMTIFSIANLILLYKLSIGRTKNYLGFLVFTIADILLLGVFLLYSHQSLVSFSMAFIVATVIFLIGAIFIVGGRRA